MTTVTPPSLRNFWQSFYSNKPLATSDKATTAARFYPLHDLALLAIEGPDASAFLQGQLTADVAEMAIGDAVFAAHCDAKGRMHANAVLYRQSTTVYLMQMPAANLEIASKALAKYAVFSKVEIHELQNYAAFAALRKTRETDSKTLASAFSVDMPSTVYCVHWVELSDNTTERLLKQSLDYFSHPSWQTELISAGIAFVMPATSNEFIPQMFNLDAIGGISFTKGCYTGQEIIARMKYLGQVKRRCYQFSSNSALLPADFDASLLIGQSLEDGDHKNAGTVVAASVTGQGLIGLAVIKMTVLNASHELLLNGDACEAGALPVQLKPPPYTLDQD